MVVITMILIVVKIALINLVMITILHDMIIICITKLDLLYRNHHFFFIYSRFFIVLVKMMMMMMMMMIVLVMIMIIMIIM